MGNILKIMIGVHLAYGFSSTPVLMCVPTCQQMEQDEENND